MTSSNQNSRDASSQKQSLLAKLDKEDLKTINIKITRKNITDTGANLPLQRGLDDPSLLVVHFRLGEGKKPIFDRDNIIVNKPEEEETVISSTPTHHRSSEKITQTRHVRRSLSRSYSGTDSSKNKSYRRSRSYSPKSRINSKERDIHYTSSKIKSYGSSSQSKKRSRSRDRYENSSQRTNSHLRKRSTSPPHSDKRRISRSPPNKEKRYRSSRFPERDYYNKPSTSKSPTRHECYRDVKRRSSRSPARKDHTRSASREPPHKGRRSRTPSPYKSRRSRSPKTSTSVREYTREDYERSKERGRNRTPPDRRAQRSRSKENMFRGHQLPPEFACYGGGDYWMPGALPIPPFFPPGYLPPGAFPRRLPGPSMLIPPRIPMMIPPHYHQFARRLPAYNQPTKPKITHPAPSSPTVTFASTTDNSDVSTTNDEEHITERWNRLNIEFK